MKKNLPEIFDRVFVRWFALTFNFDSGVKPAGAYQLIQGESERERKRERERREKDKKEG